MKIKFPANMRKWLFVLPILAGILIFGWLAFNKREPEKKPPKEAARVLRVIRAPQMDVLPRVLGHGTAQPARVWRAVAEVEGRVIEINQELKQGAFLGANDHVLKIDPREYELIISQLEAEIAEVQAQLAELETQEENDRASLAIEQASLALAKSDLDRVRTLFENGSAAPTELRDEERTHLAQKQKVQNLQNALKLIPRQRTSLNASLAVKQARLEQARLDLEKTIIRAPFACRLGEVRIEVGQFLKVGETLFEADGTAITEVDMQLSFDRGRNLLHDTRLPELGRVPDMETLRRLFNVEATVRMRIGDFSAEWPARFSRVREQIDPVTRTAGVVVAVDKPYEQAVPGKRPPLVKGTFCEVELRGKKLPDRVVIPRAAWHGRHAYVVDSNSRLERRDVEILFTQSNFLVVEAGLGEGEMVVVSDPTPAVEGMLIQPVTDDELLGNLIAEAEGRADVR